MTVAAVTRFFGLLTIAAQAGTLAIVGLALAGPRLADLRRQVSASAIPIAWLVAATSTAGSLYLSEVAHFVPCPLCWYQRIAMYPLVAILGVAALRRDVRVWMYALPLTIVGGLIAIYHYQLERFPSQSSVGCAADAPCTVVWVWLFHYISIPMMALSGFAFITALLLMARRSEADGS